MINTIMALVLTVTTMIAGLVITSERPQLLVQAPLTASPLTGPGRFEKTKKWRGSFTVTGSGGGQGETVIQSANGTFTLNPTAAGWGGNSETIVSVADSRVGTLHTETWQGSGPATPNTVGLLIDEDSCTYSLVVERGLLPVTHNTSGPPPRSESILYAWGPFGVGLGLHDVALPASGRTLSGSRHLTNVQTGVGITGNWDITWSFECDTEGDLQVSALRQNDPEWRAELYDHSTILTIWGKGCALTSLAMAMGFSGFPLNPSTLNSLMITLGGFVVETHGVNWTPAVNTASSGDMKFHAVRSRSTSSLDEVLCMGFPVIVGVKLSTVQVKGKPVVVPGHFVIVTGRVGSDFLISDPAGVHSQLSQYGSFETRGFVTRASWNGNPTQCGGQPQSPPSATIAVDKRALTISAGNNVELLVIDPSGRRTGHETSTGNLLEEIPESVYFRDALEDDQTGVPPDEITRLVQIEHPVQGSYQINVIGLQQGPYSVEIQPYSQDGTPQTQTIIQGTAPVDSSSFQFQYISSPGATPTPTPTPTVTPTPTPTPTPATSSFVQFSSSTGTATETLNATTKVDLTVNRTGDTSGAASVNYGSSDGTANERSDYLATFGTLRFQPGETSKIISVFIVDDSFGEGGEGFNISLSDAVGTALSVPATITVTISSNEAFNGANPVRDASFSSDFFVREHYVDFFNRETDTAGLSFWKNQIDECTTQLCREIRRINVSAAFFLSIEFQQTGYLVYKANQAAFRSGEQLRLQNFLPDTHEIGRGVIIGQPGAQMQLETNKQNFFNAFVQRPAFLAAGAFPTTMTAAEFVDKLNEATFDPRNPAGGALTQGERDALVSQLSPNPISPILRAQVLRSISENGIFTQRQFNKAFVLMQYFGYLRRNPDATPDTNFDGYNFWLGKLNQFNGNFVDAEMVKAFITSGEYIQRFGP